MDSAASPFDALGPLQPLMNTCVHCGFCLPTCPSYALLAHEADSPRGRIYLARAGVDGRIAINDRFVQHFDTCLGCLACETACPSGVRYAPIIEKTRALIEQHHARPLGDRLFRRLLFLVLPFPARLRLIALPLAIFGFVRSRVRAARLFALLPPRIRALAELAPEVKLSALMARTPAPAPAAGTPRLRVALLTGCVQRVFFDHVNRATVRVLSAEGCEVTAPPGQGCCGALALHSGFDEEARAFARRLIAAFDGIDVDQVVVNAAGCGSAMKGYGKLLSGDPQWAARASAFAAKVRDVTEVLSQLGARAPRHPLAMRVAYHDACHLAHAQGIRREPRELLAAIPGLEVVSIPDGEMCCGSAGVFNLVEPEMGAELGRRKVGKIAETTPDAVATSNPGCLLQISAATARAGQKRPAFHVIELLDASIAGADVRSLIRP